MPRFSYQDVDKYGSTGNGGSFFKLENDGDIARVQLLGRDMNDFPGYAVHEVEIGDRTRYVNCLREAGDPVDVCPFCAARKKQIVKLFIPMFNIDADEIQVWERGKKFFGDLAGYCRRIKDVSDVVTEIERHGKAKETTTSYNLYKVEDEKPEKTLDDFSEDMPEILGRYILDKTADEMDYYLDRDEFPDENAGEVRRRGGSADKDDAPQRRTPNRRSSREEEF